MRTWLALFSFVSGAAFATFSFSAEHLYLTATRTGLDYALFAPADPSAEIQRPLLFVEPKNSYGQRLIAKGGSCELPWSFQGRYVHFEQKHRDEAQGPNLLALFQAGANNFFDTASSEYKSVIEALDLLFDYNFSSSCLSLRPFFGTKFARINEGLFSTYTRTVLVRSNISQTLHGYGLQGGLAMNIALFTQRLSFLSRVSVALLQSSVKGTWQGTSSAVTNPPFIIDFFNEREAVVRMFEIQTGLELALVRMSCLSIELFGGYEMHGWQIPDFVLPLDDEADCFPRNQALLGLNGTFVGVRILF